MKPVIVITITTILFLIAVSVFYGSPTEEELCLGEGGVWRVESCHPVER